MSDIENMINEFNKSSEEIKNIRDYLLYPKEEMDFPNVKQEGNYNYNFEEYISPVYNRPYTKKLISGNNRNITKREMIINKKK